MKILMTSGFINFVIVFRNKERRYDDTYDDYCLLNPRPWHKT